MSHLPSPVRRLPDVVHRPDLLTPPARPPRPVGLGDAVARVAEPIAGLVDKLTGSKLVGCQPCGQRRDALNRLLPNLRHPFSR